MGNKFIGVRDVDEETFKRFRARAIERRLKLGSALNLAMQKLLDVENRKNKKKDGLNIIKNLLKIKPIRIGNKKVRWSEEVDQILYRENDNS